ncbi:MAG TPA: glucuronate isomerase [Pirellulales bacterium]|jgi:glucuronate isomerase|nr:glucuronate isomerase [Pirellulales bacterium]
MSAELQKRLFAELNSIALIDPHTHIDPRHPASETLADLLGYHYFTELIHSAGMPREQIEQRGLHPKELVARLVGGLEPLENTIQYSWLIETAREFFGFDDERITAKNWESLYDRATSQMATRDWAERVLIKSGIETVFLTNDFDDPLEGFDTRTYVPCLRTDDLVFHLSKPAVLERLEKAGGISVGAPSSLRHAIGRLFEHFISRGARACAISLPPDFTPRKVSDSDAKTAMPHFVFWMLAEFCAEYRLPFDLMIGVNRRVYEGGVTQGRDLFDSRVSLIQYRELFNSFPQVTFPISVLASVTNQELVSYAWIFPNIVTHGHWWYSNTPPFIEHDLAARLMAIPATKQIGYYSDMYKLEFALPKFAMFKRILAKVLAERFVVEQGWSEERAVALGRQVLRGNVERVFGRGEGRV